MAGDRAHSLGPDQPDAASRAIPLAGTDHCVDLCRLRLYAQSDSGTGNAESLDGDGGPDATFLRFIMVHVTVRRTVFREQLGFESTTGNHWGDYFSALLLFAAGARRLPLATLGLLQFIAPTCFFILGIFLYEEPFSQIQAISFGLIWIAVVIYLSQIQRQTRLLQENKAQTVHRESV